MRTVGALLVVAACGVDFDIRKAPEPGLARRIAERKNEVLQNPNDVEAQIQLGLLQVEGELWFEAAETLLAAKQRGRDDVRINAALTTAYFQLGYAKSGIEELKACLQKDRSQPDCLFSYGKLIEGDPNENAQQELRAVWLRFLALAPAHPKAGYVRSSLDQLNARLGPPKPPPDAAASQPSGEPPPAPVEHGAAPVPGHPGGSPEGREGVGELNPFGQALAKAFEAAQRNDPSAAAAAFREALAIRPDDPGALAGLAEMLFAQNQMGEAIANAEKAFQLDPKDAQVRWAFGLVMMKNGRRTKEALAAWQALRKDDPEYAEKLGVTKQLEAIEKVMGDAK
jgi:tetratricopeptide (TPR) repeat protein